MNIHIVRVNEKVEKIANIYNLTKEEIMKINHHIQDWDNLIPGTKLRLPEVPENVELELDNTEPFIEEYYPRIDINEIKIKNEIPIQETAVENESELDNKQSTGQTSKPKKVNKYPYYPYPYYGYYNDYNYYRRYKSKNKK